MDFGGNNSGDPCDRAIYGTIAMRRTFTESCQWKGSSQFHSGQIACRWTAHPLAVYVPLIVAGDGGELNCLPSSSTQGTPENSRSKASTFALQNG